MAIIFLSRLRLRRAITSGSTPFMENDLANVSLYAMPLSLGHFWSFKKTVSGLYKSQNNENWNTFGVAGQCQVSQNIVSGFFQVPTLQNIGKFAFICGKAKSNLILALNNSLWHIVKGQLISKGNLSVFNSPKKRTWKC